MFLALCYFAQIGIVLSGRSVFAYRVGDQKLIGSTIDDISTSSDNLKTYQTTLQVQSKNYTLNKDVVGLNCQEDGQINHTFNNAKRQLMIPIWGLIGYFKTSNYQKTCQLDQEALSRFVNVLVQEFYIAPVEAKVELSNQQINIIPDVNGRAVNSQSLMALINQEYLKKEIDANGVVEVIIPATINNSFNGVVESFNKIKSTNLRLNISGNIKEVPLSTVLAAVGIENNAIKINQAVIATIAEDIRRQYNISPINNQTQYRDGQQISFSQGSPGQTVSVEEIKTKINNWFSGPSGNDISIAKIAVPHKTSRSDIYTASNVGLNNLINNWVSQNAGTYKVYLRDLSGRGFSLDHGSSERIVSGSIYKVFLAYYAYYLNENSGFDLNNTYIGLNTAEQCIEKAIIYSDNDCAESLAAHLGWSNFSSFVTSQGFGESIFNLGLADEFYTSAKDTGELMYKIATAQILNDQNRQKLISYMSQQVYRSGIPAGSPGASVSDKVGFIYGIKNDAAIVTTSKGSYVLVILTDGTNWLKIAELAKSIFGTIDQ